MEINCNYQNRYAGYECCITFANITEKDQKIKEFKGDHVAGRSKKDVTRVLFWRTNVNYFPRGLGKHFPNLIHLKIVGGGLKEISRKDLKGLDKLISFRIRNCELTSLPDDLFTDMTNLRIFAFCDNKIEFASSKLLKPLQGREDLIMSIEESRNKIRIESSCGSLKSFEDMMRMIDRKFKRPAPPPDPLDANSLLKEMFRSEKFSDLTIIAGERKFTVHKTILAMKNDVFADIFDDNEATEINIPDFSSSSVEALLKFIYKNEISTDGNAKENFDIANKFKVPIMKSFYEKVIGEQINESNAWINYLFAHCFSSQLLKVKAFQLIFGKFPDDVPNEFMDRPETLRKLIDARRVYEELLKIAPKP